MAGIAPGPGQTPMQPGQQSALAGALQNVSPPRNSKTPFVRTDPEHVWLIGLQRVRQSLHDLDESLDDKDDVSQAIVGAMNVAVNRLMAGVPPNEIALLTAASLLKPVSPPLAAQTEQQWMEINRAPTAPGPPIPTGPPGMGGPGAPQPNLGVNPGVMAAMAAQAGGPGPGPQMPMQAGS